MKSIFFTLSLLFVGLFQNLHAQSSILDISGNITFEYNAKTITVEIGELTNLDDEGSKSGSLKIAVYFTEKKYKGKGALQGMKVFEKSIDKIDGGYLRRDISLTGNWLGRAPNGKYYVVVAVLEYSSDIDDYYIIDSHNFTEKIDYVYDPYDY